MDATWKTVQVTLPQVDVNFLKTLARKMGWQVGGKAKTCSCRLDKAIEAAEKGPLCVYNDIDELMAALND